ncbi:hypothetical protein OH781_33765 [Streptomyces sp. NBC_01550]|uniref:hypothetical protein n=1 Tax=Streptomyces sp. NBC_01550 TaxID=2975875 RepID=UPI00386438C2
MLVTALSPEIGYDKASQIAHKADDEGTTLREAALATGYIAARDFDRIVDPKKMVHLNAVVLQKASTGCSHTSR